MSATKEVKADHDWRFSDNHNHNLLDDSSTFRTRAQTTHGNTASLQMDDTRRDAKRPRLAGQLPPSQMCDDISQLYGVIFRLTNTADRFLIFRSDRRGAMAKVIFRDGLIDVLEVKPELRGHDLGGLLVSSLLAFIQPPITLEAEEEESKYGKLVRFYQQLGFQVKDNARIQYVHHQAQVFRKVPMVCWESSRTSEVEPPSFDSFIPIHLVESNASQEKHFDRNWMLIANQSGVYFRTTRGISFTFDENGEFVENETPHVFQLASDNGRFLFRSTTFGSYLSLRKRHLSLQPSPVHWKTSQNFRLICVPDQKMLYMEQSLAVQSETYVQSQLEIYGRFLRRKSLYEVLLLAKELPAYPLETMQSAITLHERCFATAEALRNAGHPDWVQLLGLLFHLGGTVPVPPNEFQWQYSVPSQMLSENNTTWTGPVYMVHMVRHNQINLPEDGIQAMRLVCLSDWSKLKDFSEEEEICDLATECAECLWKTNVPRVDNCESLWNSHYARIVTKYSADGVLCW